MLPSEWIKLAIMTPLQLQVAAMRVCSNCHRKTLVERHCDEEYLWMQCAKCNHVYCLPFVRCCVMPRLIVADGGEYCGNCGKRGNSVRIKSMTEQEYIDATNLAKLRTMKTILHDVLAMRPEEVTLENEARFALAKWINLLEPLVAIDPEKLV